MFVYGFWFYEELVNRIGIPRPGASYQDERDREGFIWLNTPQGPSYEVRSGTLRMELFRQNPKCVNCHRLGQLWILESDREDSRPHLNLYHVALEEITEWKKISANGLILMTKDHIIPKSIGGPPVLENYQTMCQICNNKKGSSLPWQLNKVQQEILDSLSPRGEMQNLQGIPHFI